MCEEMIELQSLESFTASFLTPFIRKCLYAALHLFCDMIIIGKESTIAFSAIDKLVALFQNLEKAERKSDSTLAGAYIGGHCTMAPLVFLVFFFGKISVIVQIKFAKTKKIKAILVN